MIERASIVTIVLLSLLLPNAPAWGSQADDQAVKQAITAYENGEYERAKSIFIPLAETGHPKAITFLGLMYDLGKGFPADTSTACDYYERSANLGNASGMYNLFLCFENGVGRSLNLDKAHEWLVTAAENGMTRAMILLATEKNQTNTDRRFWLNKAARSGSTYAKAILWIDGHDEDAPDLSFLDSLCVRVKILIFHQGVDACDD